METVIVNVTCYARPQLIAPHGRWSFDIVGKDFELRTDFNPACSPVGAERAALRLCRRLGWQVQKVNVEKLGCAHSAEGDET